VVLQLVSWARCSQLLTVKSFIGAKHTNSKPLTWAETLVLRKWDVGVWTGLSWLRIGADADTSDCGNELSGFIKFGEFLD
jgi:hypothetical protein